MSSADGAAELRAHEAELLELARASIAHGLAHGRALAVDPSAHAEPLRVARGCFVTLRRAGALRGCVGRLEAEAPLVCEVADRAWAAASQDPRFAPLTAPELGQVALEVSVLGPLEPLGARTKAELVAALRPGVDGLVLASRGRRATFLPSVWESVREPERFVGELERKAGLPTDAWSVGLEAWRYRVVSLG